MDMPASEPIIDLIPQYGEHALILGRTGSGKTAFARWLLSFLPGTIIYDTKGEKKFNTLTKVVVSNVKQAMEAIRDEDYVIVRPPVEMVVDPMGLDQLLYHHYQTGENVNAYIDEAYQFHRNGQAGPGLVSLLTRGRSRGISTIAASQRPAWVSRFLVSEVQKFYVFALTDKQDHKRLEEVITGYEPAKQNNYHFSYFDHSLETPILFTPIPFEGAEGYTDTAPAESDTPSGWL